MGFHCEAAMCWSEEKKRKNLTKYPWMRTVSWVKFPTKASQALAWKKLLRRKDKFELTKHSRICSRHFDAKQILPDGHASGSPQFFFWNDYGSNRTERDTSAIEKRESADAQRFATDQGAGGSGDDELPAFGYDEGSSQLFAGSRNKPLVVSPSKLPLFGEVTVGQEGKAHDDIGDMRVIPDAVDVTHPKDHDYIRPVEEVNPSKAVQTDFTSKDIEQLQQPRPQTQATQPSCNRASNFVITAILSSNERINYYTGIESRDLLNGIWNGIKDGAEKLKFWRGPSSVKQCKYEYSSNKKPGRQPKLSTFFMFLMTLIRLRLNLPILLLADLFDVGASTVTDITVTWIAYLHQTLYPALVFWPSQEQVRASMPVDFKRLFPDVRVIIDCTEFFMDRPSNKDEQYKTYSSYKSHNTYKCLVGINPNGAFTFVSDLWGGNVSDKHITQHSGLIEMMEEGDSVMADRGFHIEDLLLQVGAKLIAPPFTRKTDNGAGKRLNVVEIKSTRNIARFRIHVERAIQRMKTFKIIKHQIPVSLNGVSTMVVQVIAALCNLKGPLYYSSNEQEKKNSVVRKRKPLKRLCHV